MPSTRTASSPGRARQILVVVALALSLTATLGVSALQYFLPSPYHCAWGLHLRDVDNFYQAYFPGERPVLDEDFCRRGFVTLLFLAWGGYAVALFAGWSGAVPSVKKLLPVTIGASLLLAFFGPPACSNDPYKNTAEGRLLVIHGLNPYQVQRNDLIPLQDPIAPFLDDEGPSIYGPIYLLVLFAVVACLGSLPVFYQALALKVLAAAGLVGMALAARGIAEHFRPGAGARAFLAVGLNPLFLLEGPGTGHNDALMMSLFLIGALQCLRGRELLGSLFVGLSVGFKYLTAAAGPGIALDRWRRGSRGTWRALIAIFILIVAPTVLAYLPLAAGSSLRETLTQRVNTKGLAYTVPWEANLQTWLREQGVAPSWAETAPSRLRQAPVVLFYLGSLVWLWRRGAPGDWLRMWGWLSFLTFWFVSFYWFPWYLIWPWSVAATRDDRPSIYLAIASGTMGLLLVLRYAY